MAKFSIVMSILILQICGEAAKDSNSSAQIKHECSSYCYNTINPIIQQLAELQKELGELKIQTAVYKEMQLKCSEKVQGNTKQYFVLKRNPARFLKIGKNRNQYLSCESQLKSKSEEFKQQTQLLSQLQIKGQAAEIQLADINDKLNKCKQGSNQQKLRATNCVPFQKTVRLQMIKLPKTRAFQVFCNGRLAGPGWMVIQRRLNGAVDFYRNWQEYRVGFGDLRREFFIGLEKLHELTTFEPYELLIQMQDFHNHTKYAHYDDFQIGAENTEYKLLSLGDYTGNASDAMRIDEGMKFTTYDRDNDRMLDRNCAKYNHGAWWYKSCSWSNLNGGYFNEQNDELIWWNVKNAPTLNLRLKSVQMLIRPKKLN